MEDSKYDGLFTTDKNMIQTVIESSPYSEEIDSKVILNINKQLQKMFTNYEAYTSLVPTSPSTVPCSTRLRHSDEVGSYVPEPNYSDITNYGEFDMIVKYHNIFYKNKKIMSIMKKKTRKLEDHRLLVEWIDSHLLVDIYNMDNYTEDPVGTAEDYV